MQSYYRSLTLPTLTKQWNGSRWVETWSSPTTYVTSFSVWSDFTGAKNVAQPHANSFDKDVSSDYVGVQQTYINGSLDLSVSGRVKAFSSAGVPGAGGIPSLNTSSLYNEALSKVYDQVRGDVDWMVNAAEAAQTSRLVREYRDHLTPLADKLADQGGRLVRFVRTFHPKQWGRRWLEYQYGVKPLVQDMHKTMVQMLDFSSNHIIRVRGRSNRTQNGKKVIVSGSFGATQTIHWTLSERCLIEAVFTIPQSRLTSLANYTSLNPASLVWETLAASFVVDWLWNVGGFLRSMESAVIFASGQGGGFVTHTHRLTESATLTTNGTVGSTMLLESGDASHVHSGKSRAVLGAGVLPPNFPQVDVKLGWQRLTSAASLLSLFVTKRSGPI